LIAVKLTRLGSNASHSFWANVCFSMFDPPSRHGLNQHVLRRPFPIIYRCNPLGVTCRLFLVRRAAAVRAVAKMPVMVVGER
jgi:hypothetical protein